MENVDVGAVVRFLHFERGEGEERVVLVPVAALQPGFLHLGEGDFTPAELLVELAPIRIGLALQECRK
jgi:hypothetical protein